MQNAINAQNAQVKQCALNLCLPPTQVKAGWMSAANVNGLVSIFPALKIVELTIST